LHYPVAAQDERWDGADDLDVNPSLVWMAKKQQLKAKQRKPPFMTVVNLTDAPDLAGADIALLDIPKLVGIGYLDATTQGMNEAAEELGNVTIVSDGSTEAEH
jgi:rhamnose transport system substrate-binding protein